jgi:hypothetical protein
MKLTFRQIAALAAELGIAIPALLIKLAATNKRGEA